MQTSVTFILLLTILALGCGFAAENPLEYIEAQLKAGQTAIVVPAGVYRLSPQGEVYLKLKDLKGVSIDFTNVEFRGTVTTRMFQIENCTDLILKGLTIDYDPLPYTQARIVEVDQDKNWKIQVIEGYPTEGIKSGDRRIQVFGRESLELVNPLRFRDGIAIDRLDRETFRISGGQNRAGELGDIVVFTCSNVEKIRGGAIYSTNCVNLRFESFTLYSSPDGFGFSEYGNTRSVYLNCRMDRRPPEMDYAQRGFKRLRSLTADAFHCKEDPVGPQIIGCTARYQGDDCINISGMYSIIAQVAGDELRLLTSWGGKWLTAGDPVQILTYDGQCPPDAKLLSVSQEGQCTAEEDAFLQSLSLWPGLAKGFRNACKVKLDRPIALPRGSVLISKNRSGNGFLIKDCNFGNIRSRGLLIKASSGVIENNVIANCWGSGMQITPEYCWMEGGCSSDLQIRDNRLSGNHGPAIAIGGISGANTPLAANSHRNLVLTGNKITDSRLGISVEGCTGLELTDNEIDVRGEKPEDALRLSNVAEVTQKDNRVNFKSP